MARGGSVEEREYKRKRSYSGNTNTTVRRRCSTARRCSRRYVEASLSPTSCVIANCRCSRQARRRAMANVTRWSVGCYVGTQYVRDVVVSHITRFERQRTRGAPAVMRARSSSNSEQCWRGRRRAAIAGMSYAAAFTSVRSMSFTITRVTRASCCRYGV